MPLCRYIKFTRHISPGLYPGWSRKRNTGMLVTWWYRIPGAETFYSSPPPEEVVSDLLFAEENKYFTLIANVIHESSGATSDMEELVRDQKKRAATESSKCVLESLDSRDIESITSRFGNISMEPIYKDEISEENLKSATEIYFSLVFCHKMDSTRVSFYQNLFLSFSLETVLKTFARILLVANENNLVEHYQTAKALFDKTTNLLNITQYRDLAVITTRARELELYPELKDQEKRGPANTFPGSSKMETLINHPLHISDPPGVSAFIPFCSFGNEVDLFGKRLKGFEVPVCSLFREKTVGGQICYEANINQFKNKGNWEETLSKGINLIIDTNDEYDVKKIMEKLPTGNKDMGFFEIYKPTEEGNSILVMLQTISKFIRRIHPLFLVEAHRGLF